MMPEEKENCYKRTRLIRAKLAPVTTLFAGKIVIVYKMISEFSFIKFKYFIDYAFTDFTVLDYCIRLLCLVVTIKPTKAEFKMTGERFRFR